MVTIDLAGLRAKAEKVQRHMPEWAFSCSEVIELIDRLESADAERADAVRAAEWTRTIRHLDDEKARTEIDRLRALLELAGKVLKPFADMSLDFPHVWRDDREVRVGISVGSFRAASTVAREIEEIGHE